MEEMVHNLGNLTTFYNRYYRSQYGAQSSQWIYNKVLDVGLSRLTVGPVLHVLL